MIVAELLRVDSLSAGYGEAVVLHDVSLSLDEGKTLALLGRNGTGKTTLINTLAGATRQHGGSHHAGRRGAAQAGLAPTRGGRHRLGAAGAQHLQVADGAREPHGRGAARQVDAGARLRDVPAAGGAQGQPGHAAVGRRAADAGRGPRAGASIPGCCCWTSRSKAWRPSSCKSCCARSRASRARRGCRRSSSSSIRRRSWRSRTARWCSTTAPWCMPARPPNCATHPELLDRLLGVAR